MFANLLKILPISLLFFGAGACIIPSGPSSPGGGGGGNGGGTVKAEDGDTAKSLKRYLMDSGYTETAASGIMGNIKGESGYRTNLIEGGRIVPDSFVAYQNGSKTFSGGFGLVQWTSAGRVKNLQDYANSIGKPVTSLEAQFGFMVRELANYKYNPEKLNTKSLEETTFLIYRYYETPLSSFCTSNDKRGCYNDYAPTFSTLSPVKTKSAYDAYSARLGYAKQALAMKLDGNDGGDGGGKDGGGTNNDPSDTGTPVQPDDNKTYQDGAVGLKSSAGLYSQFDFRNPWRKDGSSIKSSGCSLIAVANALRALGRSVDPGTMAAWSKGVIDGPTETGWDSSLKTLSVRYGLVLSGYLWDDVNTDVAYKKKVAREALSSGNVVIISGDRKRVNKSLQNCTQSDVKAGSCVFSYNGHFAVLVGITADDKAIVANPASSENRQWTFPIDEVLKYSNKAKAAK